MKKAVAILCVALMSSSAFAAIKCEPDRRGGMCCWDTVKDGPFKPINCY
jgi:hypothetical protein|nr:MAG TPA: exopolysaccharide production protein [Caudoviricetes sp.]